MLWKLKSRLREAKDVSQFIVSFDSMNINYVTFCVCAQFLPDMHLISRASLRYANSEQFSLLADVRNITLMLKLYTSLIQTIPGFVI